MADSNTRTEPGSHPGIVQCHAAPPLSKCLVSKTALCEGSGYLRRAWHGHPARPASAFGRAVAPGLYAAHTRELELRHTDHPGHAVIQRREQLRIGVSQIALVEDQD